MPMPKISTKPADGKISVISVDLGKNTSHVIGLNKRSMIIFWRKSTRNALEKWFANLSACLMIHLIQDLAGDWP